MTIETFAQFANLRHIAPTAPKSRTGDAAWSIAKTLREADRVPSACRHVPSPLPPHWILGSRVGVGVQASAWHLQARQSNGKAWPKTSPALACAVISFPRQRMKDWVAYRNDTVAHFSATYGRRLVGAVEHLDEAHPHLHIYLVPLPGEDFGAVQPEYGASRAARKLPGNRVRTAYNQAMQAWQDALHAGLGHAHGLTRVGPKRARMTRAALRLLKVAKKEADRVLAAAEAEARAIVVKAQRQAAAVQAREEEVQLHAQQQVQRGASLDDQAGQQERHRQELIVLAQAVRQREQQLAVMPQAQLLAARDSDRAALKLAEQQVDTLRFRLQAHEERVARAPGAFIATKAGPRP